ncbi:MAG: AAA family ATPase [Segniliparus sp.]|uniref:ATP-binding protein n=1 Tax=Segniliparus sp. TaxID=2804064 RepID=UPI003F407AD5
MGHEAVIAELLAAVAENPDVVGLRVRAAGLLAQAGRLPEALQQCVAAVGLDPANESALQMLQEVSAKLSAPAPQDGHAPNGGFDWAAAEEQVKEIVEPAFVSDPPGSAALPETAALSQSPTGWLERPGLTLDDVAGMAEVKERLEAAFLAPMRNPALAKAFGLSLKGGLLLYGPPGCGKTFIAKALAGELGANFYQVGIAEVLDMYIGQSERNLKDIFEMARRNTPCVLFFDEVDALGQKRSHLRGASSMRSTVNQLLSELDSAQNDNDGVFVLAATNAPWDVDAALKRPGRFDRTLLVLPPDAEAREGVIRLHLRDRPLAGVNLDALVRATEDFSGADLAHLCLTATQRALTDSLRAGEVRPIAQKDFEAALKEVKPSTGEWFAVARNVATHGNVDGAYDELAKYFKRRKGR